MARVGIDSKDLLRITEFIAWHPLRPHRNTVNNWIVRGVQNVKLPTLKVGGKVYISKADYIKWTRITGQTSVAELTKSEAK